MQVEIYTDGACLGNPGPGGWAAILESGRHRRELSGADAATTNNRMELSAAIEGLKALRKSCDVVLFTDSRYVMQGMTEWLPGWRRKGWRTASGKPVENRDLWEQLVAAAEPHEIRWKWVRGHNGVPGNERADALARAAAEKIAGRTKAG
ncbi:MAG TPA: ribonuclease HI [Gammaproteobacteria bacterium]|nr:ribonuclease HI [Gammaproteobacteria bacterium]